MSYLDTRQALLTKLAAAALVPSTSIAYENKSFDPSGLSIWLSPFFIPATDGIMGKTSGSRNEHRGIFQVSVYVSKNATNFDSDQLDKIDDIISEFSYGSSATYSAQTVEVLESTVNGGRESESWYVRDISINYLTFSVR